MDLYVERKRNIESGSYVEELWTCMLKKKSGSEPTLLTRRKLYMIADLVTTVNYLHPFVDGNTRA